MRYEIFPEEYGGKTIVCPISCKTGDGIDNLLESLILLAETKELLANPEKEARGIFKLRVGQTAESFVYIGFYSRFCFLYAYFVRQTFKITGAGNIAGCYVLDGKIVRGGKLRIYRDDILIVEGGVSNVHLRHRNNGGKTGIIAS